MTRGFSQSAQIFIVIELLSVESGLILGRVLPILVDWIDKITLRVIRLD